MKVLLLYDVEKLGRQGQIVDVSGGYARNYLLPRQLVTLPTKGSAKQLELAKRRVAKRESQLIAESEGIRNAVEKLGGVKIVVRANAEGKLYGSISPGAVKELLKEKGIAVEAKRIILGQPIKSVGEYEVAIKLHKDQVKFRLVVEPEELPQEAQPKLEGDAAKQ